MDPLYVTVGFSLLAISSSILRMIARLVSIRLDTGSPSRWASIPTASALWQIWMSSTDSCRSRRSSSIGIFVMSTMFYLRSGSTGLRVSRRSTSLSWPDSNALSVRAEVTSLIWRGGRPPTNRLPGNRDSSLSCWALRSESLSW